MRKTLYLGDATVKYLEYHSDHKGAVRGSHSLSKVINIAVDRLSEIVKKNLPQLTANEWLLVVHALKNSWTIEPANNTLTMITGKIEEGFNNLTLVNEYDIDVTALKGKLQNLSTEQRFAMIDVAEVFWLGIKEKNPEVDDGEAIEQALSVSRKEY